MSTLRTNALEGVDAKNSITIVAGAGNITTTNVQEGLLKVWLNVADNSTNNDSLNVSSVADTATGRQKIAITNPFRATTTMSGAGSANETDNNNGSGNNNRAAHFCRGDSTSEAFLNTFNCSGGSLDDVHLSSGLMNGDLA